MLHVNRFVKPFLQSGRQCDVPGRISSVRTIVHTVGAVQSVLCLLYTLITMSDFIIVIFFCTSMFCSYLVHALLFFVLCDACFCVYMSVILCLLLPYGE